MGEKLFFIIEVDIYVGVDDDKYKVCILHKINNGEDVIFCKCGIYKKGNDGIKEIKVVIKKGLSYTYKNIIFDCARYKKAFLIKYSVDCLEGSNNDSDVNIIKEVVKKIIDNYVGVYVGKERASIDVLNDNEKKECLRYINSYEIFLKKIRNAYF